MAISIVDTLRDGKQIQTNNNIGGGKKHDKTQYNNIVNA